MLLIGSLTWCPKEFDDRAEQHCRYLQLLSETVKENEDCSWLIIDNNSDHPLVVEALAKYAAEATVIINPDNYGWPVARNQMICEFEKSTHEVLVMQDCDEFLFEKDWPTRVLNLHKKCPNISGYCIRGAEQVFSMWKKDNIEMIILSSGVIADVYFEHIGSTTIINREVMNTVGGYNWKAIPSKWGYHDPEYGRRLKKSGLLVTSMNKYIDPIRVKDSKKDNCDGRDSYYKAMKPFRDKTGQLMGQKFYQQEVAIANGTAALFVDYHDMPKPGEIK